MGCKKGEKKVRIKRDIIKNQRPFIIKDIKKDINGNKGRLQFFFHSPSSKLPIRDILNEKGQGHKTEPHIEIGAENYIYCCYQPNNIVPFITSDDEKYLFLYTTCENKKLKDNNDEYMYNRMYIIGYILKKYKIAVNCQRWINNDCKSICEDCKNPHHFAIRGPTKIFSFKDAFNLELLYPKLIKIRKNRKRPNPRHIRRKLDFDETNDILEHFNGRNNIIDNCVFTINELDKKNEINDKTCIVLRGGSCDFEKKGCRRSK